MSQTETSGDIDDLLLADADAAPAAPPDLLSRITAAADTMRKLQEEANRLEEQASNMRTEARRLSEQVLPPLMDEAGVPSMAIDDGANKLERVDAVFGSISAANAAAACQWLEEQGYGDIVKTAYMVDVPKGEAATAKMVQKALDKVAERYGVAVEYKAGVHPATLRAFVKERVLAGKELPQSITYHVQPTVTLTPVKAKTTKTRK